MNVDNEKLTMQTKEERSDRNRRTVKIHILLQLLLLTNVIVM